ncbi:aminomethyltransferase [Litorivivens lipolytica]|uniref:aminomethyltransferase n=1 Tax=Litorivivens lipolytica TaxID=1524264 RepID=A0A7W4Z4V5_9GAMM|nr:glycine cleavage system aminomethyltransferase GcvT [Litorivivens lipolytica]MBB3046533.1 aminomethyltransferase [Litorivivens lipolytica]
MSDLLKTPLFDLHEKLGAKMVPFAGYAMPVQYPEGVLKEHLATRDSAGLFDVSHMGQIRVTGEDIAAALESALPQDVIGLAENRQRYGLLTNEEGGILDDLMFANCGDHFMLVVNAACKHEDLAWLRARVPQLQFELLDDKALLALQGPKARAVMERLAPGAEKMVFMDTADLTVAGIDCWVSCSGYTGEDGYEISVPSTRAAELAEALLACDEVSAIGLGARDSLRLEAGLCLYGHDIDTSKTPVTANLKWAVNKARRPDGERAGGYPGSEVIAAQWSTGVDSQRVLLDIEGRAPVREGVRLVDANDVPVGVVTSGGFGPSVSKPVAMGYVSSAAMEGEIFAEVRKKKIPIAVRSKPFVEQRYFRG